MKNTLVIFLLFIFVFNLGGSLIILKIQQYEIRKDVVRQIKQGIADEDLIAITVTLENQKSLVWKDSREFSYLGIMYDIIHFEKGKDGTIVYHCLSDIQETQLIAKYYKEFQRKQKRKNNRNSPLKIFKFVQKIRLLSQAEELAFAVKEHRQIVPYNKAYSPLSPEISSPPPKQIL